MKKRTLASFLWFLVGWQAGGVLVSLLALPAILGFAPGVVMAALVLWDPTGLLAPRATKARKVIPINEYAAGLERNMDRRIEQWPAVETETKQV